MCSKCLHSSSMAKVPQQSHSSEGWEVQGQGASKGPPLLAGRLSRCELRWPFVHAPGGRREPPLESLPKRVLIYLIYPCLLKVLSVNIVTLGVGIQHMNFGRDIFQSTAWGMYSSVAHNLHNSLPPWHWLESEAIHHYMWAAVFLRAEVRGSEIIISHLSL